MGVDPGGADAWTWQDLLAPGFSIGAPPDEFKPDGQSWGLPPWIPWRLRDAGYRPLARSSAARWSRGGGLRIDHVMGLTRLFWVPEGGDPADGAYVRFAGHELLEVVALESARAGGHRRRRGPRHRRGRAPRGAPPPADPLDQGRVVRGRAARAVARASRSPW